MLGKDKFEGYPGLSTGSAVMLLVIMLVSMVSCNTLTDIDNRLRQISEMGHQHITTE